MIFIESELEIIEFNNTDIITTSNKTASGKDSVKEHTEQSFDVFSHVN